MPSISSFIGRFISFISIILMGIGFFMLIKTIKKSNRVRGSSLLFSMVFSVGMLLFNVLVMRSARIQWWFPLILIFGAGFGFAWGTTTTLNIQEKKILGKRSVLYIYFWLASMLITQVLAFFAKTNAVAFGLAGMFFSTGASLGTNSNILYRMQQLLRSPRPASVLAGSPPSQEAEVRFCVKCGAALKENAKFCSRCGWKTETANVKTGGRGWIIGGATIGIAILSVGGFLLLRSLTDNQNPPSEPLLAESGDVQAGPAIVQPVNVDENPDIVPDSSHETTSHEKGETQQGGDEPRDATVLSEDFNSSEIKALPLFSDQYMQYYHSEGLAVIESTTQAGFLPIIFPDLEVKNFTAEFDFMMPEASEDSYCGIFFRSESDISDGLDAYYALFLYPKENSLNMGIWIDGQWIHSPNLNPDPPFKLGYEFNHIRLEVLDSSMKIYANDSFVSGFEEDTISEPGLIGLFLFPSASVMDGGFEYVLFDNLKVWKN